MRIPIRSLNIGGVQTLADPQGRPFRSAVRKTPRTGAQRLGERGFANDESLEECHHTPNMDVHVFSLDRYPYFESLAKRTLPIPAFGENLSVVGGLETDVCIGDRYAVGEAVLEVSQPTERCATPGNSLGLPMLRKWIESELYTGYYLRVIRTGYVSAGDELVLVERPLPRWSVDRVNRALFRDYADSGLFEEVLSLRPLSDDWKDRMRILRARWLAARLG